MARELKRYARKRKLGLVPHLYDATHRLRGVVPPVTPAERYRQEGEARQRAWENNPWPGSRGPFAYARG